MLAHIKTYLLHVNRFCGVEHTTKNNRNIILATRLRKHKKALYIEDTIEVSSVKKLAEELPKKQSIFLTINDGNILTKSISTVNPNFEYLVHSTFPNIEIDSFYYEIISQDNLHFVSISRREYIDAVIAEYKEAGITIINLSLGQNIIINSIPFIKKQMVFTSNALITIKNQSLVSLEKERDIEIESYDINGLEINSIYLLSLSGALETVINSYESITNYKTLKLALKDDFYQKKIFQQFSKFCLIFILTTLLVNFIFFNYYFNKVNKLQQILQVNQNSKTQLLKLNETVIKSQKTVDDMLKSSSSKSSFYVNAIIQELPNSILLSELNYQPLKKNIKKNKAVELKNHTIIVSGESNNSDSFSKWIANLEHLKWIHDIKVLSYEDTSNSNSRFSIILNTTHDQ